MVKLSSHESLPRAMKEDNEPFSTSVFVRGAGEFFVFVRWTSYHCPECGHVFRRDYWVNSVHLGTGKRTCSRCGAVFDDGSREWPELPRVRKARVLCPPLLTGICGGFLLAGVLTCFLPPKGVGAALIMLMFDLVLVAAWSLVRLPWVIQSVHRYNARP